MKRHKEIDETFPPADLEANAYTVVKEEVRVDYSESEVTGLKAEFFELNSTKDKREKILEAVKIAMTKDFDHESVVDIIAEIDLNGIGQIGIKALKSEIKTLLKKINSGYDIVKKKLYGIDYQEIGLMAFYDKEGQFIYQRGLSPSERQASITSLRKKSS